MQGRLRRLESRLIESAYLQKPRRHLRIVVRNLGGGKLITSNPCRRVLCPAGTLMEVVRLCACHGQDIDQWVASFPVLTLTGGGSVQ